MRVLLISDGFVTNTILRTALACTLPDVETASISSMWPVPPFRDVGNVHGAAGDEDELIEALDGCDVALSHTFPFTEKVVAASPSLKLVTVCRGGLVNVSIEAATRARVLVSHTPGRNATVTAEYTAGMILASLRQTPQYHWEVIDGQWRSNYYIFDNVDAEIGSSTVGVVGYDAVERRVAAVMTAFGACVLVYDLWANEPAEGIARVDSLGEPFAGSDVVTIHTRVAVRNRGMIDADTLALMPEGSVLVNCARGGLADYGAVCDALDSDHLFTAGFDVLPQEPLPPGHRPLRTSRVTITPHLAGASEKAVRVTARIGAEDVTAFAIDHRPPHLVNPEALGTRARLLQTGGTPSRTGTAPSETNGKTPRVDATGPETGRASSETGAAAPETDPKTSEDDDQAFGKWTVMFLEKERRDVVKTYLSTQSNGLIVGATENVLIHVDDRIAISPSGMPCETMTTEDVVVFSMNGERVDGVLEPPPELPLHLSVYRRTTAKVITHNHVPTSTALGLVVDEILPSHYYSTMLGGVIRVAPYAKFDTDELTRSVTDALKGRSGALMRNHDAVTVGPTAEKAADLPPILEYVCEIHLQAMATGAPVALLSPEQMADTKTAITDYGKQPNRE